jgi:hypothetical protein
MPTPLLSKQAHSYQRILDEVSLFLHLMEETDVKEKNTEALQAVGCIAGSTGWQKDIGGG